MKTYTSEELKSLLANYIQDNVENGKRVHVHSLDLDVKRAEHRHDYDLIELEYTVSRTTQAGGSYWSGFTIYNLDEILDMIAEAMLSDAEKK